MRRRLLGIISLGLAILLAMPADLANAAASRQVRTGGEVRDNAVHVDASDQQHTAGSAGTTKRVQRARRKTVNHRAVYASLRRQMVASSRAEAARRSAESRLIGRIDQAVARCVASARHWERRSVTRVVVNTTKRVRKRHVTHDLVAVKKRVTERYKHWYTAREVRTVTKRVRTWFGTTTIRIRVPVKVRKWRWRTRTVTRVVLERKRIVHTRIVNVPVRRVVTRRNPVALAIASGSRACERSLRSTRALHARRITARRAAWNAEWAKLNLAAHDAWQRFNTTCRTVGHDGGRAIQDCGFDQWRNYRARTWTRRVVVTPPTPSNTIVQAAKDQAAPPAPRIRLSPSERHEQIVQLPTWMWVDGPAWKTHTARAEAGRAWAEARAVPTRVVWNMGNGDTVVCSGPGKPYDTRRPDKAQSSNCTYTYETSSAGRPHHRYTVSATVVYRVTWKGSNGSGGSLGEIRKTSSTPVRVAEIQALDT